MIRIRYLDFSGGLRDLAGLHASARRDERGVTVYLLPGLTGRERQAALRRLRQEASRGFGPALPLPGLLLALGLDRLRSAAGTVVAIVALRPVLALLPGAAIAAMTLFVLASVSGGTGPAPRTGLDGVLTADGHAGSAVSAAASAISAAALRRPVVGPAVTNGGSGLGSGAPAPVWQARPHQRHHRPRHRRFWPLARRGLDAGVPHGGFSPADGPRASGPRAGGPPAGGPRAGGPPAGGPPAGGPGSGGPRAGGPEAGGPPAGGALGDGPRAGRALGRGPRARGPLPGGPLPGGPLPGGPAARRLVTADRA